MYQQKTQLSATQLARELAAFQMTSADDVRVTALLQRAAELCHLVSPAMSCPVLPEGLAIATSFVLVDLARETYPVRAREGQSEKRGLSKTALDRISLAAGVTWDPVQSRRLDNGSDPYYCLYSAIGLYRHFDGTDACLAPGTKELDLREGSPAVLAIIADVAPGKNPDAQIRTMRAHIVAHAETKARLRAIRSLGLQTSYLPQDLAKPFVIARAVWTGQTQDPVLRREFALLNARRMMGGRLALYGEGAPARLTGGPPQLDTAQLPAPPPLGASLFVDDEDDVVARAPLGERSTAARASSSQRARAPSAVTASPRGTPAARFVIPGGPQKGMVLAEATDVSLTYWIERISRALDQETSRDVHRDTALVDAMLGEQRRRHLGVRTSGASEVFPDNDNIPF